MKLKRSGNFIEMIKLTLKTLEDKNTIYLAFSRSGFFGLIFVIGAGIAANIAIIDFLIRKDMTDMLAILQFAISAAAVITGLWLFLRGVNIAVE